MGDTGKVVWETSSYPEAVLLKSWLEAHDIPCELLNVQHSTMSLYGAAVPIRLLVPDSLAARARILIERRLSQAEPLEEDDEEAALPGPIPVPEGYEERAPVELPPRVAEQAPDARGFCKACRYPSTQAQGACGECGAPLAPLLRGARVCPEGVHVLSRVSDDSIACSACKAVWPLESRA